MHSLPAMGSLVLKTKIQDLLDRLKEGIDVPESMPVKQLKRCGMRLVSMIGGWKFSHDGLSIQLVKDKAPDFPIRD